MGSSRRASLVVPSETGARASVRNVRHTPCYGNARHRKYTVVTDAETADTADLTRTLLRMRSTEQLALDLGVSAATIRRWESGAATPRPRQEGALRALAATQLAESPHRPTSSLEPQLAGCLADVREALHRRARLSSRAEALDEVAKILFAHFVHIETVGEGLAEAVVASDTPAQRLHDLVRDAYARRLPETLSREMPPADFALRIKPSENALAQEIAAALARVKPEAVREALADPVHADVLNGVFGSFLADSFADERQMGQYLTPAEIVDLMVDVGIEFTDEVTIEAWLAADDSQRRAVVLDPSCGVASFLVSLTRRLLTHKSQHADHEAVQAWLERFVAGSLAGIDKSERMVRLAVTNFALLGNGIPPLHLANALSLTGAEGEIAAGLDGSVRLILTNPPFGAEFRGDDLRGYEIADGWSKSSPSKVDSELLFLERYLRWLQPGGVAVAIVPDSILTNRGLYGDLRAALRDRAIVEAVVSLPPVTFAAAGTTTKTSVLAIRKAAKVRRPAYVAVCTDVGFDVETRGSHRRKVRHSQNDLPVVRSEIRGLRASGPLELGRLVENLVDFRRWDAGYHASLPREVEAFLRSEGNAVRVGDVAALASDRVDPRRSGNATFRYIEISDVDSELLSVRAKPVATTDAPSRARKRVRAGDVLVSTVRPERRTIGVVLPSEDGAVCSTGFAVLRPRGIDPFVLAALLKSDFANAQLMRNNMGVAYPAIDEECLIEVVLPASTEQVASLAALAGRFHECLSQAVDARGQFLGETTGVVTSWERSHAPAQARTPS
jgi:transcriptional regulator with XRE-family HTH domain